MTKGEIKKTAKWVHEQKFTTIRGAGKYQMFRKYIMQKRYKWILICFMLLSIGIMCLTAYVDANALIGVSLILVLLEVAFCCIKVNGESDILNLLHKAKIKGLEVKMVEVQADRTLLQDFIDRGRKKPMKYLLNDIQSVDITKELQISDNQLIHLNHRFMQVTNEKCIDNFVDVCKNNISNDSIDLQLYFIKFGNKICVITVEETPHHRRVGKTKDTVTKK